MLTLIVITSLKILFIYQAMKPGMILYPLRRLLEWFLNQMPLAVEKYLSKPLYGCVTCMASIWGFIFTFQYASATWRYATILFAVSGLNSLIGAFIGVVHDIQYVIDKEREALLSESED